MTMLSEKIQLGKNKDKGHLSMSPMQY